MAEAAHRLKATLPLPPTSNNIYINNPRGGRTKSTQARAWQTRAVRSIHEQCKLGIQSEFDENLMYWLEICFYFSAIENKGWHERYVKGVKKGQRKAKSKWKRIDLSNRVKLLEDTVKMVTGVDDCATFVVLLSKEVDPKNPRVEVLYTSMREKG